MKWRRGGKGRIEDRRGRYNISHVALFVWRLQALEADYEREHGVFVVEGVLANGTPVSRKIPAETYWHAMGYNGGDRDNIVDASFVKLREIALGYTFDQPWVNRYLGLTSLDVRLAGRNLKTWTDYTGIDPETNLGGAEVNLQGIDYFNNPVTRVWVVTFGLNR